MGWAQRPKVAGATRQGRDVETVTGNEGRWNGAIDLGGVLQHEERGGTWDLGRGKGRVPRSSLVLVVPTSLVPRTPTSLVPPCPSYSHVPRTPTSLVPGYATPDKGATPFFLVPGHRFHVPAVPRRASRLRRLRPPHVPRCAECRVTTRKDAEQGRNKERGRTRNKERTRNEERGKLACPLPPD